MYPIFYIIIFIVGIVLLYLGGTQIVEGSVKVANKLKIPTIVIGLTVVAMGTSMPELFVSMMGALKGSSDIAVGNVIGSNIFNIIFVLALTSLVSPVSAGKKSFYVSIKIMFVMYVILLITLFNFHNKNTKGILYYFKGGIINPLEGVILVIILCAYIYYLYRVMSKDKDEISSFEKKVSLNYREESLIVSAIRIIFAILALAFGSDMFINGAVGIFSRFISEHVIGFIIIAVGTSIPELVTSFIAAVKKESDISIGNIVGSNIFNVGAVLGISSIASAKYGGIILNPVQNYIIDYFIMVLSGILLYLFTLRGRALGKTAGIIFLALYVIYVGFLIKTTNL